MSYADISKNKKSVFRSCPELLEKVHIMGAQSTFRSSNGWRHISRLSGTEIDEVGPRKWRQNIDPNGRSRNRLNIAGIWVAACSLPDPKVNPCLGIDEALAIHSDIVTREKD